jgi:hypothetical protein
VIDMAEALAARTNADAGPHQQARMVFRLAYQREPTEDERSRLAQAIDQSGLRAVCRAVLNSSELIYLD